MDGSSEHLDTDADVAAIGDALTRIGLEVEGIEDQGAALADFVVAKVLTAQPHPNADKLQLLTVDAGGEPLQVVCGAPNARAGLVACSARPARMFRAAISRCRSRRSAASPRTG